MREIDLPKHAVRTPWLALIGIISTASVYAVAQGLTTPLLSIILEKSGVSALLIGLSAAMTPLGMILCAPLIPWLTWRFGAPQTVLSCAGFAAALILLIGWTKDFAWWFPLRLLLGASVIPLYVLSEVWLIALVPAKRRGRVMGLYTATISIGFAAGPIALICVGFEGWPPFLIGAAAFAFAAACLIATLQNLPKVVSDDDSGASVRSFLPLAPLLLAAVAVASIFEQSIFSLLAVYGAARGLGEAVVATLLAIMTLGNIVLQIPLGLAAERLAPRNVLAVCAAAAAVGAILVPVAVGTPAIWPLSFMLGATSFGIYTMSIVELGNRFSGTLLVAGNSAFAIMWGVGGITGPPLVGTLMDVYGPSALPLTLSALCTCIAVACLRRGWVHSPS